MNSQYAETHKRAPKPAAKKVETFRLEPELVEWIEINHHNKSSFYQLAVKTAIKRHKKRKEKES